MGLFQTISDWQKASYARKMDKMRSQNTCPDCRGKCYDPLMFNEFASLDYDQYRCTSCNGIGTFSAWEAEQRESSLLE